MSCWRAEILPAPRGGLGFPGAPLSCPEALLVTQAVNYPPLEEGRSSRLDGKEFRMADMRAWAPLMLYQHLKLSDAYLHAPGAPFASLPSG